MTSAVTRRHLLMGAVALPVLAGSPIMVGEALAFGSTVYVSSYSQLASAVKSAKPGTEIVLRNGGRFSGDTITVAARGSASRKIVIRAQSTLGVKMPNGFRLTGEHLVVRGIDFAHSGTGVFIEIAGSHNTVERCRFRAYGSHVQLVAGNNGKVLYCEFSCPGKDAYAPNTMIVRTCWNRASRHTNAEIAYCYFHNMPHKPSNYSARIRVSIGLGNNGNQSQWSTNHYIHHNLLVGTGDNEISVKTRNNRIEYCTMIGDGAHFNQRFGGDNVFRGCYAENNRGFGIMGKNNKLIGCRAVGLACDFKIFAGNQSPTSTGHAYPQAVDTVLAGCDGRVNVGATWKVKPAMKLPATRTRLEKHSGKVLYGVQSGTRQSGYSSESLVQASKLSTSRVGPFA